MFEHWGKPTRYMEKKLRMKNSKTGAFRPFWKGYILEIIKKNTFGVLLMKSEYG